MTEKNLQLEKEYKKHEQLQVVFLIVDFAFLATFGILAVQKWWYGLIVMFVWGLFKVYQNWDSVMWGMRSIEIIMFGKPLESEYWQEQKPKMKKFVWKVKK